MSFLKWVYEVGLLVGGILLGQGGIAFIFPRNPAEKIVGLLQIAFGLVVACIAFVLFIIEAKKTKEVQKI